MKNFKKILILISLFICITYWGYAGTYRMTMGYFFIEKQEKDDTTIVDITINGNYRVILDNIPSVTSSVDIYSILGVKTASVNLKSSASEGYYYLDLPKGIYILKAGKIAQKIIIR